MQRILLICCFFASTLLTSCGFYEHRARIILHKEITATNDTLDQLTKEWHQALNTAVRTKSFADLKTPRVKLGQFISRRRSLIANLEVPKDAETLRESEGIFLSTQAAMVADVYPQFEAYAVLTPEPTIQKTLLLVSKDLETEMAWKYTIQKALNAFAVKHGIKKLKK